MGKSRPVELHPLAPDKPGYGARCNGCGLCCAVAPCPVAMVFLLQFRGKCRALQWQDDEGRYACGMALRPDRYAKAIPRGWRERAGRFFASRIAAGTGCDFDVQMFHHDP